MQDSIGFRNIDKSGDRTAEAWNKDGCCCSLLPLFHTHSDMRLDLATTTAFHMWSGEEDVVLGFNSLLDSIPI